MAMNLYSAKTYKVEYAPHPMKLYRDGDMLLNIFSQYDVGVFRESNEQSESWEIVDTDFAMVLENLERENKDIYNILKDIYDTADKSDGYVHLFWF